MHMHRVIDHLRPATSPDPGALQLAPFLNGPCDRVWQADSCQRLQLVVSTLYVLWSLMCKKTSLRIPIRPDTEVKFRDAIVIVYIVHILYHSTIFDPLEDIFNVYCSFGICDLGFIHDSYIIHIPYHIQICITFQSLGLDSWSYVFYFYHNSSLIDTVVQYSVCCKCLIDFFFLIWQYFCGPLFAYTLYIKPCE